MSNQKVLKELISMADHLDQQGLVSLASLFDFVANIVNDADIVNNLDNTKVALAKCADYMDETDNKVASDLIDEALVILADKDIPGRYGPIGEFDRLKHSEQVYNTESPDMKQEKRKRNDEPSVKGFGTMGPYLKTRYCPDHNGVQTQRIGESVYQCPLDKKVYNYETGYTNYKGEHIPGGSVSHQTPATSDYFAVPSRVFDSRENLMNPII